MAKKSKDLLLDMPPDHAFALARASAYEIKGFRCVVDDPSRYALKFSKGFGLTNPMEMEIWVQATPDGRAQVNFQAGILALADPFGFLTASLEQFSAHLENHRQAWLAGTAPSPPPANNRALWVNVGCIGAAFLIIGGFFLLWLIAALAG